MTSASNQKLFCEVCSAFNCSFDEFVGEKVVSPPYSSTTLPLQYSCLEYPMNSMRRQHDRILKEELPRSVGAKYATGDQWRNNSRKNEGMEPKQKNPVVDVTDDRSKV